MCLNTLPSTSKRTQFADESPDVSSFLPQLVELPQQILQEVEGEGEEGCTLWLNRPVQFPYKILCVLGPHRTTLL